ncbi:hypothetical protein [Duganella violaceipulchra]|uniref:Uncharacterized protein n=1 Tax=Duganella violaceipulchra TaxID=2849652 RepID=A0AA41L5A1_9BURK|nr:hypothetical protein [Duganella violaceicalia]MBV6321972.1 hypothetical protein [Duganella violaceicalia]MCP2007032.1 hypothetical protein [Duganella violaceicalia]
MKERPILFSSPMVRALLDGSKTQTRRIVKPDPGPYWNPTVGLYNPTVIKNGGYEAPGSEIFGASDEIQGRKFPYGQPGDRLWVRESGIRSMLAGSGDQRGLFRHDVPVTPETGQYWVERTRAPGASYSVEGCSRAAALLSASAKVTPSIHMPRWASRILLEIISVRAERLNDISDIDAVAEGIGLTPVAIGMKLTFPPSESMAVNAYRQLWEQINGEGSWADNPWVWCVEFRRVTP